MEQENKEIATDFEVRPFEALVSCTERGWIGHFICGDRCMFRRNTLLECGEKKIVVSTVGMMRDINDKQKYETIGVNRYFETMAFHAEFDGTYWDADVSRQINFQSEWAISDLEKDSEERANKMHENVVAEIKDGLKQDKYS